LSLIMARRQEYPASRSDFDSPWQSTAATPRQETLAHAFPRSKYSHGVMEDTPPPPALRHQAGRGVGPVHAVDSRYAPRYDDFDDDDEDDFGDYDMEDSFLGSNFSSPSYQGYMNRINSLSQDSTEEQDRRKLTESEVGELVERLHTSNHATEQRIAQMKELKARAELEGCTFSPQISAKAKQSARHTTHIWERSREALKKKQEAIDELRKKKEEEENRILAKASPTKARSKEAQENWSRRQQQLQESRLRRQEERKMQLEEDEECTFRPELNQKSLKIFRQFRQTSEKPHERLLREHSERCAKKEIERDFMRSEERGEVFQPRISPKAERLQMRTGVFDRLYGDALTRKAIRAGQEDSLMDSTETGSVEAVEESDAGTTPIPLKPARPSDATASPVSSASFSPPPRASPRPQVALQEVVYRPEHDKVIDYLRVYG